MLDPSRNMSYYRQRLQAVAHDPPVIPMYPVVKKDLFVMDDANKDQLDGLVNFEKLRMIAKEIRSLTVMSSAPYELGAMSEQSGSGRLNDALINMNSWEIGSHVATMNRGAKDKRGVLSRKAVYEQVSNNVFVVFRTASRETAKIGKLVVI